MTPFRLLFLLFIALPIAEVWVLIEVGGVIGAGWTILLIVATAMIGAALLRVQGLSTWSQAQRTLARGQIPAFELLEGAVLLVCGALLLTPGFITDAFGFLGLLPWTRRIAVRWIIRHGTFSASWRFSVRRGGEERTVDGEFHRIPDPRLPRPPHPPR